MSIRKIAAQAALLQGLFLIAMMIVYIPVMTMLGMKMEDWSDTTKAAQFMVDHKGVFMFSSFLDIFSALTIFVLAAAYTQKFSRKQPWLGIIIGGAGVISSALFLASGVIGVMGIQAAAKDALSGGGLGMMKTLSAVQWPVETAGVFAISVVVLCTAMASARTKAFANWVSKVGIAAGVLGMLNLVLPLISPMLGMVGMLGMIASILFNLGVAMSFMKQEQPELNFSAQMG